MPRSSLSPRCWISLSVQSKSRATKVQCVYCISGRKLHTAFAAVEQSRTCESHHTHVVWLMWSLFLYSVSEMQQLGAFSLIRLISTIDKGIRSWNGNQVSLWLI